MKINDNIIKFVIILFIGIISHSFIGCSSAPIRSEKLEEVQKAYDIANANPEIISNAAVAMHEAKRALENSKKALRSDPENLDHLLYIAERKLLIAQAKAEQRIYEKRLDQLTKEKQNVLMDSRQKEAERAIKEAEERSRQLKMKELEIRDKARELEEKAREIERAREQARQLEMELSELQAKQTNRGIVLTLGDVLFGFAKAELMPSAMRSIDKLGDFLKRNPKRNVLIEGHTDNIGSQDYNLVLSQNRANSVRKELLDRGVDPSRVVTKGYGKLYPVADNNTETGRRANRRVEIVILNEGESAGSFVR